VVLIDAERGAHLRPPRGGLRHPPHAHELRLGLVTEADERAARRTLREQIARLEAQLADAVATAFATRGQVPFSVTGAHGPRVLGIAELERVRDDLATRLGDARRELTRRGIEQERARVRLERMLLAPGEHKFARVAAAELGENGCGVYQVRPRLGLIGMLAGWWHVKLSSGCPLAT
jgi:uncharacterized small protein (DUF1192 family)